MSGIESAAVQTGPGAHPASCTMGTGYFLKVKSGRGVALIPHLLLVPWSKKSRAIPLLPLWAVRPVQSLIACTRVHFTLLYSTLLYFTLLYYKEVKDHSHCVLCTLGKRTWYPKDRRLGGPRNQTFRVSERRILVCGVIRTPSSSPCPVINCT